MHDVLQDSNTLLEEEDADEIIPMSQEIHQNSALTTKECAVDGIEMICMDEFIKECKSKDDKECKEYEVLKIEMALLASNCRHIEQIFLQCNTDKC